MELTELKGRISGFYKDWFEAMATFEGGTLKVKTPFYDQNFNELVFKISQASGGEVKVTLVHPMIRYFTNSDLILQLAEEGGYKIDTGISAEEDDTYRPANISKIVDPMTVVDSIHNFVEFFYCGQFMMRLTAFLAMMERAGVLDETNDNTDTTDGSAVESNDSERGSGEKGIGDNV